MLALAVATVLTVYGIETTSDSGSNPVFSVATVLTVYGIETLILHKMEFTLSEVATVLTVYGIETERQPITRPCSSLTLQQYLPFTVLKQEYLFYLNT